MLLRAELQPLVHAFLATELLSYELDVITAVNLNFNEGLLLVIAAGAFCFFMYLWLAGSSVVLTIKQEQICEVGGLSICSTYQMSHVLSFIIFYVFIFESMWILIPLCVLQS